MAFDTDQGQIGLTALPPWLAPRRGAPMATPPFLGEADANAATQSQAQTASPEENSAFKPPEKAARMAEIPRSGGDEATGPDLDRDAYEGRVARPTEGEYPQAKTPLWRKLAGAAAGGMEGYATESGTKGAELGRSIVDEPQREREAQIARDQQQWDQAHARGAQLAQPPAAPASTGDAVNNDNPQANAAASLGLIESEMAKPKPGATEVYGGPTGAQGSAAPAAKPAATPIARPTTPADVAFNDLMTGDNGKPRINPETKQPYTAAEAERAVAAQRPAARGRGRAAGAGRGGPKGAAPKDRATAVIQAGRVRDAADLKADQRHGAGQIDDRTYAQERARNMGTYAKTLRTLGQTPTADTGTAMIYFRAFGSRQAAVDAMKGDGWVVPNE